jgi:signal peptidase I
MPILSHRKSYAETVEGRRRFLSRLKVLLLFFVAFCFVSGLLVGAFSVSSEAMKPGLQPGDLVLGSPLAYGPLTVFGKPPAPTRPDRGDLVLVDPPYAARPGFWASLADSFVRFVSFQRLSLKDPESAEVLKGPFIERVIALPGDEVRMDDFVFKVRPAGTEHFLTEFELSDSRYDITKGSLPEGWSEADPLSGTMPPRILGKDEYFVAGDNREAASDSRLWGPLGIARFRARIFLRYWPFSRFGGL